MTDKQSGGPLKWIGGLVVLVLAGLGYIQLDGGDGKSDPGAAAPAATTAEQPASPAAKEPPAEESRPQVTPPVPAPTPTKAPSTNQERPKTLVVQGPNGRTDLAPTLLRIERGEKHSHRNDGSVFQNREGRLPSKPRGYYREYVHPTQGQRGPGAQRIVIGNGDEIYYTADHYRTFRRVSWQLQRK